MIIQNNKHLIQNIHHIFDIKKNPNCYLTCIMYNMVLILYALYHNSMLDKYKLDSHKYPSPGWWSVRLLFLKILNVCPWTPFTMLSYPACIRLLGLTCRIDTLHRMTFWDSHRVFIACSKYSEEITTSELHVYISTLTRLWSQL